MTLRHELKSFLILLSPLLFSACVNMNQHLRTDVNVLKAKVANLEAQVIGGDGNQIQDLISGEQKRGEYLQQQLYELTSRLDALEGNRGSSLSSVKMAVSQGSNSSSTTRVISDKMASPPSIKEVQLALRNAGYYDGAIDGVAGSGTQAAIKSFQKKSGLGADGVVGHQTWKKLKTFL